MIYEGKENYIFISYSHLDSEKVFPFIKLLINNGFRVWFDAGIEAGTEWPEYIEEHINNANVVLVFMTPNTVESKNCRNEINYALNLGKEVLVVYLEETILAKGMHLQLNSTQSLFRQKHPSNETFIRELLNARILQSCHTNSKNETVNKPIEIPQKNTSLVANVCSVGANDENDMWPKRKYSQTVNRDEFRYVFFHIFLVKPFGFSGTSINKYKIYNPENILIFENEQPVDVEPNYDKVSTGWCIKGTDGSFIPSGKYKFVCSINNSPEFTYFFSVSSNDEQPTVPTQKIPKFLSLIKEMFED